MVGGAYASALKLFFLSKHHLLIPKRQLEQNGHFTTSVSDDLAEFCPVLTQSSLNIFTLASDLTPALEGLFPA